MMTQHMRNLLLGIFVVGSLAWVAAASEANQRTAESYADDAPPLPWFVLPEYGGATTLADSEQIEDQQASSEFGKALDALLAAQGSAFDRLIDASRWQPDAQENPQWALDEIAGDLALTADGKIGILAIGGQIMVRTHWLRRRGGAAQTLSDRFQSETPANEDAADAIFDATMSDEQLQTKLVMMIDAMSAAGKIRDRQRALQGLRQVIEEVRTLMAYTPVAAHFRWRPTVFRFEVSIDINGQVLPYLSVGGDVRLQLDWKLPATPSTPPPSPWKLDRQLQPGVVSHTFASLVTAINADIESVLAKPGPLPRRFRADNFQIMVGMTASGQVGIARGAIGLSGILIFKPATIWQGQDAVIEAANQALQPPPASSYTTLPLISDSLPNREEFDYQRREQITGAPVSLTSANSRRGMLYHVSRQRFRNGIALTQKIGAYFADRATKIGHRHWFLKQFRFDFDMSISGSLGLATLLGRLGARITYATPSTRAQGKL